MRRGAAMQVRENAPEPVRIGRNEDDMNMTHASGSKPRFPRWPGRRLGQKITVESVVVGAEERRFATIAALGDMMRSAGRHQASDTGHGSTMAGTH